MSHKRSPQTKSLLTTPVAPQAFATAHTRGVERAKCRTQGFMTRCARELELCLLSIIWPRVDKLLTIQYLWFR